MFTIFTLFVACVTIFVCVAATTDFCVGRIPNVITVPAAAAGLVFNIALGMFADQSHYSGLSGLLWSLAGFGLGMALLFVPFAMGGGGAGDVKFLAALGTWLGPWYLFITFILGMIFALFAGLYKWATIAAVEGPWKAKETLGARSVARATDESPKPGGKKRRKTRLALVVPLAVSCVIVLGAISLEKATGRQVRPWPPLNATPAAQ